MTSLSIEERAELGAAARGLLTQLSSSERVRAVTAEAPGYDTALWDQMVELGFTTIHVPERYGGSGTGFGELAVVMLELGRMITPSPFLASAVLASSALSIADNEALAAEVLEPIVSGASTGAVAFASTAGTYEPSLLSARWERTGGTLRLSGSSGFVVDGAIAGALVVAAVDAQGTIALLAVDPALPGVTVEAAQMMDVTQRTATITFDGVELAEDRLLAEPGPRSEELLDRILAVGAVAAGTDAAGAIEKVLESAVEYAGERQQFGKPIGSFQAVKHHCANMAMAVETCRAAARAAADALDTDPAGWSTAGAICASHIGPRATEVCGIGLRVHGGIGYTWEHDSHLYLKRVKLDELLFGTPSWHRRRLARTVMGPVGGTEKVSA
jgi:alkylation response protein AidB-like acyl-CoA dehydrogenase